MTNNIGLSELESKQTQKLSLRFLFFAVFMIAVVIGFNGQLQAWFFHSDAGRGLLLPPIWTTHPILEPAVSSVAFASTAFFFAVRGKQHWIALGAIATSVMLLSCPAVYRMWKTWDDPSNSANVLRNFMSMEIFRSVEIIFVYAIVVGVFYLCGYRFMVVRSTASSTAEHLPTFDSILAKEP